MLTSRASRFVITSHLRYKSSMFVSFVDCWCGVNCSWWIIAGKNHRNSIDTAERTSFGCHPCSCHLYRCLYLSDLVLRLLWSGSVKRLSPWHLLNLPPPSRPATSDSRLFYLSVHRWHSQRHSEDLQQNVAIESELKWESNDARLDSREHGVLRVEKLVWLQFRHDTEIMLQAKHQSLQPGSCFQNRL